jgi:hypothetical protein
MKRTRWIAAATIVLSFGLVDLSIGRNEHDGARGVVGVGAAAHAKLFGRGGPFRRIASGFRRFGRTIGKGIKTVTKKVGQTVKKIGKGVVKVAKKVGTAIKKGIQKIGQIGKKLIEKLKKKLLSKLKGFAKRVLKPVKRLFSKAFSALIGMAAKKLGVGIDALEGVIDRETGRVNMNAIKQIVLDRIGQWVNPMIEDKVRWLVDMGMKVIRPLLDGAVSAVIGAVGTIPFAGGLLAAGLNVAFSLGIELLVDLAVKTATGLAQKFVMSMISKGFDALVKKVPAVRNVLDKIAKQALKLMGVMKRAGLIGPKAKWRYAKRAPIGRVPAVRRE